MTPKRILFAAYLSIIAIILVVMTLTSCSSVRKSTTKTETKTDSTHVVKSEQSVKTDSSGTKQTDEKIDYERETVFYFDTTRPANISFGSDFDTTGEGILEWLNKNRIPIDAKDFFPTKQKIKYVTIKEKGKTETRIVEAAAKAVEQKISTVDSAKLNKTEKSVTKEVKRTHVSFWWWVLLAGILFSIGWYLKRKYL